MIGRILCPAVFACLLGSRVSAAADANVASAFDGTYVDADNVITIRAIGPSSVDVYFDLSHFFKLPNGMEVGGTGENEGPAPLRGNVVTFSTPGDPPLEGCSIVLVFLPGNRLSVDQKSDSGACTFGARVNASGEYHRRDARTPGTFYVPPRGSRPTAPPPPADPLALQRLVADAARRAVAARDAVAQVCPQVEELVAERTRSRTEAEQARQELARQLGAARTARGAFVTRAKCVAATAASGAALASAKMALDAASVAGTTAKVKTDAVADLDDRLLATVALNDALAERAASALKEARDAREQWKKLPAKAGGSKESASNADQSLAEAAGAANAASQEAAKANALSGVGTALQASSEKKSLSRASNDASKAQGEVSALTRELEPALKAGSVSGACDIRRADWNARFAHVNPQGGDVTSVLNVEYADLDGDGTLEALAHLAVAGDPGLEAALRRFTGTAYTAAVGTDKKCALVPLGSTDAPPENSGEDGRVVGRKYVVDAFQTEYALVGGKFVQTKGP